MRGEGGELLLKNKNGWIIYMYCCTLCPPCGHEFSCVSTSTCHVVEMAALGRNSRYCWVRMTSESVNWNVKPSGSWTWSSPRTSSGWCHHSSEYGKGGGVGVAQSYGPGGCPVIQRDQAQKYFFLFFQHSWGLSSRHEKKFAVF